MVGFTRSKQARLSESCDCRAGECVEQSFMQGHGDVEYQRIVGIGMLSNGAALEVERACMLSELFNTALDSIPKLYILRKSSLSFL